MSQIMKLTYRNLDIEIQTEGIISIDSLHIRQRMNEHGKTMIKALVEEEKAMEIVERAASTLSVHISRADGKKQTIFCGKAEQIRAEKEQGLFYLYMDFCGYTREWDLTEKSQSFCKGKDTYGQVLTKALSEYGKAQIRDEITQGALIPGILMQYEETDWTFLKRLASHFSTYLLADNTAEYGKAYFGIPHMDYGTVLEEEEYTLLKGKEKYERLEDTGDLLPQEMMRWRLRSCKHMQFGEQVMLGYIETVVTAVDIMTVQGELVYEYELSRRKGILTARKKNPRIFGMSIPATVKERKGNQVRVQLDIDPAYEPSEDLKWFTYAIETSNFYCMPEEGSRVHIYFPDHEEQSAMAVHALRMGGSASQGSVPQGGGSGHGSSTSKSSHGGTSGGSGGSVSGGAGDSAGASAGAGALMGAPLPAAPEAEEAPEEEKDPDYKVFSDPSGSYLELAPYGITFSPGSGSVAMTLQKSGMLSLNGLSMNFNADRSILVGTGKGIMKEIQVEAEKTLQMSLTGGSSQITVEEETNILSTFVKKDAKLKLPAKPLASKVRADLTANDVADRAAQNAGAKDSLMEFAVAEKQRLLEEKEKQAKSKILGGIFSVLTVVATVALVVATGGAALPLAIAIGATATFKTVSAVADIAEGVSDLNKARNGDLSQSYNFMRDGVFGGNEGLYEGAKAVNDIVFGLVTGKAVSANLANVENANKVVKTINSVKSFMDNHKKLNYAISITGDVVTGCIDDYVQNGSIDPVHVVVNVASGTVKGFTMNNLRFNCGSSLFNNTYTRKAVNVAIQTTTMTSVDYVASKITGEPFDPVSSVTQNMIMSSLGESFAEPVDAVTGAYLITAADMLLPDIRGSIRLERNYRSTDRRAGWLGMGWRHVYEGRLLKDGELLHVALPEGHTAAFLWTGERFDDIIGNGRFTLSHDGMTDIWHARDLHEHKDYCYDDRGRLVAVTDRNGQSLRFSYQGEYPEKMETPLGHTVSFTFNEGRLAQMTDDMGRSIGYRYEGNLLTEVVHMDGGVTRYAYSEQGYLVRPTDQTGLTYLENTYDGQGRVILQTLENGDTYRADYHDREKKVCVKYSAYPGRKEILYDERLTVREVRYPDESCQIYGYDEGRNRILSRDRLGRETHREYDSMGHLVKEEDPAGLVTEYGYDGAGDLVCVRDNGERERLLSYDACHNLTGRKEKTAEGAYIEKSYSYDALGRLTHETDGEGHETCYRYEEGSAYPASTLYSDGTELKCEYSHSGRKLSEDDGAVRWEYAYNQGGWRTMERDGEGNETHYLYDGMGRKLAMYSPRQWAEKSGKRTDYRYDFLERLTDTAYPDGSHEKLFRDGEGNILKKVHPNAYDGKTKDGEGTSYDYDGENRLLRIHYPDGGVERFFYDAEGNRIKHVLPEQYDETLDDGEGWTYAYDAGDRLVSVTGPEGIVENTYAYDPWGNCVRKTDEKGCSAYYTYDLMGRLIRELVPVGEDAGNVRYRKTSYAYDDNGNRIKETRHGGSYGAEGELLAEGEDLILTFAYDAKNRLVRVEDGQAARISYRYDARGNRTGEEQVIRAGNAAAGERAVLRKIRYSYDRAGRLIKKTELLDDGLTENPSGTPDTAVTSYSYDANGNRTGIITPEGCHISRRYDERDRLIEECVEDRADDIRRTTIVSYDKAGNILSVRQEGRDGQAREISYDYDLKDRLIHAAELDGPVLELTYDRNDRRKEQKQLLPADDESYGRTEFRYDMRGNLTGRYRDDVMEEQNSYDIRGNRLTITDGDGVEVSRRYGIQNEQLEISTINSREQGKAVQKLSYDARGRITGVEDGCGGKTHYALDGWGRITAVGTPEGGREEYAYDQAGNIIETTDARGGKIRYAYNSQGKVCAVTDQSGNTETFRYDREGRQIQHTDRKGTRTETKYNVHGQPVLKVCTDNQGNRHVMGTWEYDDFGQLKKSVAGGFCYTYTYRPDGKLLKKWSSGRLVISCSYYKDGSLKSLTDVTGKTLHYGYDEAGRLSSLKDDGEGLLTEYAYTAVGRLREIRTRERFRASYEYDGDGNLSRLRIGNDGDGSLLYDAFMVYDLNGNRTGKTGERLGADGKCKEMHTVYRYDLMNRLTEERRGADGDRYSYDLTGNRLKKQHYHYAMTAGKILDEQSAKGTMGNDVFAENCDIIDWEENYCYNERNQLTEKRTLSGIAEYLYDENGSLVSEKEGEKTASYRYDLLNRQMYVKTLDGKEQENLYDGEGLRAELKENGKVSTFLFKDGESLVECDGDNTLARRHMQGAGLSHVQTMDDGAYHAYHHDEQGSTAYVTGNRGAVENCYVYDAFGNVLEKKEDIRSRILYTGQQYDQETGQYYLRARYYNPLIGRFTQEDIYRGDGLNLYAYCGNNPVMYYDPSGYSGIGDCPKSNQAGYEGDKENSVPKEYDIVEYGEKAPGFENHHGVMDKWLTENVDEYSSRAADSTSVRLTQDHHAQTKSIFQKWKIENFGFKGKVDWKNISPREIFNLSEQMFDAAGVPQNVRNDYYTELTSYLYKLLDKG
ncbi:RHS repeat-associated core domain-containing protein [Lachnospiraceae bacterium 64-25]